MTSGELSTNVIPAADRFPLGGEHESRAKHPSRMGTTALRTAEPIDIAPKLEPIEFAADEENRKSVRFLIHRELNTLDTAGLTKVYEFILKEGLNG